VVVARTVPIESAWTRSSGAIRTAVIRALEADDEKTGYVIHNKLDDVGQLKVDVTG